MSLSLRSSPSCFYTLPIRAFSVVRNVARATGGSERINAGASQVDKLALEEAIIRSGWPNVWEDQLDGLWLKLQRLAPKRGYQRLLSNIKNSNDRSNLVASVLEVTFAYQFESAGIELDYEVKHDPSHPSSVDFRWKVSPGLTIYIETRLLQRDKATTDSIEGQLRAVNAWSVAKDGDDEQQDIIRVQRVILEKVQKEDGTPTKFLVRDEGTINILAVDISQIILGMFDHDDCLLVGQGDPAVAPICQRGVFGLFQELRPEYPDRIRVLAESYAHLKRTLHGILFLFKRPKRESLNNSLEHFLVWNPSLMDRARATEISKQIRPALPLYKKGEK